MKTTLLRNRLVILIVLIVCTCLLAGWGSGPKRDDSDTTKKLESLPRAQGPRPVVTIYEFRSSVPEVSAAAATDMFTTALIKSGSFAVAERQRLNDGVMQEKQMNTQGMTTGNSANQQLAGAQYIFEGTVSEANPEESKTGLGGTLKGLGLETSGQKANLGLDVRVVDANTGVVLDAVNVRKPVKQGGFSVKGVGAFAQKFTKKSLDGADASVAHESKEGIDQALRACIEQAVYELVKRYGG